jgi:hypothetical protein
MSTDDVCTCLGVSRETIRQMRLATPEDYTDKPWMNLGTTNGPNYKWRIDRLYEWAERTHQWRNRKEEP